MHAHLLSVRIEDIPLSSGRPTQKDFDEAECKSAEVRTYYSHTEPDNIGRIVVVNYITAFRGSYGKINNGVGWLTIKATEKKVTGFKNSLLMMDQRFKEHLTHKMYKPST